MGNKPETSVTFAAVDPQSTDALASMTSYFDELHQRFERGFDPGDTLRADADQFRPPAGEFILGSLEGTVVSCGGVYKLKPAVAEIKRMWVAPGARGKGIGAQTLHHLELAALRLGADQVLLDTNSVLLEAIRLYTSRGNVAIESYNDNPYAQRWFAKKLGS